MSAAPGSFSEGLSTKVLPTVQAMGNIQSGIMAGKLKGQMPATTCAHVPACVGALACGFLLLVYFWHAPSRGHEISTWPASPYVCHVYVTNRAESRLQAEGAKRLTPSGWRME